MKLYEMTAASLSGLLQAKEISAVEVVQSFLDRITLVDPYVKAFILQTPDTALAAARVIDEKRLHGEPLHPLAGVPIAVKDNICTNGLRTTCASRILENFVPPYDATVVKLLQRAGMPLLGKTNMDEFAMGSSTENSAFFPTHNPWDLSRVPGGSSGGSAAAVAAGMAPLALGSDTGGSIRQPASLCGLTGMRPTYGRVSRYGLIAFASSLDQIGPLALTALDSALLLSVIAGFDPLDSTSLQEIVPDYSGNLGEGVHKLKVGIIKQNVGEGFDPEVTASVLRAVSILEKHGAEIGEVSLPLSDYGLAAYYLIAPSEASSNLGRYDGVRYGYCSEGENIEDMFSKTRGKGFGPEVKRRIMIGTYALSAGYYDAYYLQAMKVRTLIHRAYEAAFGHFDLLIGATTPNPAFNLGEKTDDPLQMYLSDVCNITDALAGVPSFSVPCGMHSNGLPMGVQLTAPPLQEELLLRVGHFLEQKRDPMPQRPQIKLFERGEL
ncbi:MAG TPA: Asp-tRNA(Asn)/Glu-tRNA(Gln) amidotransferase subunit GatA [Candidatus Limnocylindrales bacterium]|nr:Asp-tRNA(Asn)/Glu-tRNA(Gln) amidotransferase subunit GatA [Candidatus Limnocylindrales bacterium]